MDMNYLVQRRINAQKKYRRKVTITVVLSVVLVLLILGMLIKVIMDEKAAETEQRGADNSGNKTTEMSTSAPGITDASDNSEKGEEGGQGQSGTNHTDTTPAPTATPSAIPTVAPTSIPVAKKKIAVDPGHGGEDLGSTRQGLYEKDANLAIALYLKKELEDAGYEVLMIRDADADVENETRPVTAVENKADLYVSIHLNSLDSDSDATQGAEVWYADLRNDGSDTLAQYVVDELTKVIDTRNRGIKLSNRLIVLKNPDMMPACLVECGFITSETERAKLFSPEYQQKIAKGIANGIKKFLPLEE